MLPPLGKFQNVPEEGTPFPKGKEGRGWSESTDFQA